MTIYLQLALAVATLAETSPPAPPPPAAPAAAVSPAEKPEIIAAKANRSRVKAAPISKNKNLPEWYESELAAIRALGEHGDVSFEGIIGVDGRYSELRVRTSSRGAHLDAFVLKWAATLNFTPAKDSTGASIATWAAFRIQFFSELTGSHSSLSQYRCDAAVRDWDWWREAWPEVDQRDYELYNVVAGTELMLNARRGDPKANEASMNSLPGRWEQALKDCRNTPSQLFVYALGWRPPADAVGVGRRQRYRK